MQDVTYIVGVSALGAGMLLGYLAAWLRGRGAHRRAIAKLRRAGIGGAPTLRPGKRR